MRYALLDGDEIVNVIDAPGGYVAPPGFKAVADPEGRALIGGRLVGGAFLAPVDALPVPPAVAMWQAKAALELCGLLGPAEAAVAGSDDIVLKHAWRDGNEFHRASPSITRLGALLELTPDAIDDLFRAAARLVV